jgi:hypothetical protein
VVSAAPSSTYHLPMGTRIGRQGLATALALVPVALGLSSAKAAVTAPRCHLGDLRIYLTRGGAAAGSVALDVVFKNRTGHACFVYGYAGFGLENARHRPRPTLVVWGSTFARRDPRPHHVVLPAGRAAYANLAWSDVQVGTERCTPSTWLEVTPPDEHSHRAIRFGGLVCNHGRLTSTALSRTRTPRG